MIAGWNGCFILDDRQKLKTHPGRKIITDELRNPLRMGSGRGESAGRLLPPGKTGKGLRRTPDYGERPASFQR
jgi:hypothetical protein